MTGSHGKSRAPWVVVVLWVGRIAERVSRLLGIGSGGVVGGRVIQLLAPGAVSALAESHQVFLVSGTNGKTTTTAYLSAALRTGGPVDTNADGANTRPGLLRTLAAAKARRVVLETDEGWIPWAVLHVRPGTAVLSNLSRDQLHRHHEVAHVATAWRTAMRDVEHVVANADDPAVVYAALASAEQTWVAAGVRWDKDSRVCPSCGRALMGSASSWRCSCGLSRPEPSWWVEGDELVGPGVRLPLELRLPGDANRGNAAVAVAAAAREGLDPRLAVEALREIDSVAGRYAVVEHSGRRARLLLAKNPASWLEALSMVSASQAPVVLAFNCDGVDGRDSSWLYDVSFGELRGRSVVVTGRRATDLVVRLEIEGLTDLRQTPTVTAALELVPAGDVQVVANYTAFQEIRRELSRAH